MAHRQSLKKKLNYLFSGERNMKNGEIPVQFYLTARIILRQLEKKPLFETRSYF
jgi:hypothetical protein